VRTFLAALTAFVVGIVAGTLTTLVYTDCKLRDAAALYESQMREMTRADATVKRGGFALLQMDAPFWHKWLVPGMCPGG
jgi:ABC-type uncharacterized transport system permease subunit